MGFKTDTKLHGNDYSWVSSMFYFGYIAFEYPTNRLLQLLPIGKFSAAAIVAWGTTLCCMAAVNSYGSALAVRFILGVCESAVTPGFALITSQWYTKAEQGTRVGIWFSFNGFAQILGGLIAYAIARGVDKHGSGIEGWKINFLWTGLLTIAVGIIFFFVVPDNQLNARFLSKEDQVLAIERIRKNQQGVGNKHFKMYQLKEVCLCFCCFRTLLD
jgi:ACS family allantoate permease-like MFS transporter